MANFQVTVNIEIDKSYCIRAYSRKKPKDVNLEIKKLSANETNWSDKILDYMKKIINEKGLKRIPNDYLEPHFTTTKAVNYLFDKPMNQYSNNDLSEKIKNILDNKDSSIQITEGKEIYLHNKIEYNVLDDIELAQLIILLSEIAKNSKKLWCTVLLQIKELGMILMYFMPEDGHISLSERGRVKIDNDTINSINQYINSMNEIIDKKREIPKE